MNEDDSTALINVNADDSSVIDPDDSEDIVLALIPYTANDSRKAQYLAYRACGFGVREAAGLVKKSGGDRGLNERTIRRWRKADPEFARLDGSDIAELRSSVALEYNAVKFTRNMTIALERDHVVLRKALLVPDIMTKDEIRYAREIRKFYTPQQFAAIVQLMSSGSDSELDYTEYVMKLSRSESIEVRKRT